MAITLGEHIRKLRTERNLKIIDVAKMTGLTSSMISQVERDIISPSIDTLKKIGDALGIPLGILFETTENLEQTAVNGSAPSIVKETLFSNRTFEKSPVVHENQRKILSPNEGVTLYLLNPDMSGPIEFIYNVYEIGSSTGDDLYSHIGSECGLILEGELEVQVGDKVYLLKKGDSITFNSEIPHRKKNVGNTKCICVWANSPPWF